MINSRLVYTSSKIALKFIDKGHFGLLVLFSFGVSIGCYLYVYYLVKETKHCTDKQAKEIYWRIPKSEIEDEDEQNLMDSNYPKPPVLMKISGNMNG